MTDDSESGLKRGLEGVSALRWASVGVVAVVYVATARIGLSLYAVNGVATPVWPPTGISLAALVLGGWRLWPGVAAGALLANLSVGVPWLVAAGIAAGNTLEAVCGYALLRWVGFRPALERVRDVFAFAVLAALFSTLVSPTIGVTSSWLGGIVPSSEYAYTWFTWWLGDALGALVVAPVLLVWSRPSRWRTQLRPRAEVVVLLLLVAVVSEVIFVRVHGSTAQYAVFPFVVWAALRIGQPGVVLAVLVTSAVATFGTVFGGGPFAVATLSESLLLLQSFMSVVAITGLLLGAVIAERRRAEAELFASEGRFRRIADSGLLAIAFGSLGTVREANDAFLRLLGRSRAELPLDIRKLTPPEYEEVSARAAREIAREGKCVPFEKEYFRKDGSRVRVLVGAAVVDAGHQEVAAFALDLTDRARAEEALREADRRKDEFLAMLSHELRNPLAPIRNAVHLLRSADPDRRTREWASGVIDRQVQHLTRLVDDLLQVARITTGQIELHKRPVPVTAFLTPAIEAARPLIDTQRHELICAVAADGLWVDADATRLTQVVVNLLANAAKYTEPGGRVWLTVHAEDGQLVISVRDTGIGISRDMLPKVFDLFSQADRSLARSQGGLGIGLTIVRRIAEMHGGRADAVSAGPGTGSEFIVRLPLTAAPAGVQPQPQAPPAAPAAQRILIVDDNSDAAESLAMILTLIGHEVRTAYDGPSALDSARGFLPEIVLLDIGLPGLDGYEVARRLRHDILSGREVVIIALTGYGGEEDRGRSQAAGFDYHLVKPVMQDTLNELLNNLASSRRPSAGAQTLH
jgi:PAS domain S-box-containing protein